MSNSLQKFKNIKGAETMSNPLQEFKDEMSKAVYGITASEAIAQGICIDCHEPALEKCYSEAGKREYLISGLCEKCFDKLFPEEEN